jgi:hypothetical protein
MALPNILRDKLSLPVGWPMAAMSPYGMLSDRCRQMHATL